MLAAFLPGLLSVSTRGADNGALRFDDNGRLSRALSTLSLLRSEYGYVPSRSMERVVKDNDELAHIAGEPTEPDWPSRLRSRRARMLPWPPTPTTHATTSCKPS